MPSAGRAVERTRPVDAARFLRSAGLGKTTTGYRRAEVVFSQGDACDTVIYRQQAAVQLSVLSRTGKEAVVAMPGRVISLVKVRLAVILFARKRPSP